jgi:hypothetical protein
VERPSPDSFRAMAGWFSRRSGSRVSIQNPVRRVLRAPSLSRNPMPPRTTRKSDRRKVSDRTMVGTTQPHCLSAPGTERFRCDSNMNLCEEETHSVSLHHWGWTASTLCLAVAGKAFVLTSPFIDRDHRNLGITLFGQLRTRPPTTKLHARAMEKIRLLEPACGFS